jgi:hypothetical protein
MRLLVVKLLAAKRWLRLAARFRRLARDYKRLASTLTGLRFLTFACRKLH